MLFWFVSKIVDQIPDVKEVSSSFSSVMRGCVYRWLRRPELKIIESVILYVIRAMELAVFSSSEHGSQY